MSSSELIIRTGNVQRTLANTKNYQEEYEEGLKNAINKKIWSQVIPDKALISRKNNPEQDNVELNVKVILSNTATPEHLRRAVYTTLHDLSASHIDLLLLRTPPDHKDFKSLWRMLEDLVDTKVIKKIGVCNLNENELTELLSFAKHRPCVNQIPFKIVGKLESKLLEFCREHNILLTAGAINDIGNVEKLITYHLIDVLNSNTREILQKAFNVSSSVTSHWAVQYTVIRKWMSVVTNRGYIVEYQDTQK